MILVHNKCNQEVRVDIGNLISVLCGNVNPTSQGLSGTQLIINKVSGGGKAQFYCLRCNISVPQEELKVVCGYCNSIVPLDQANIPDKSGGIYCKDCFGRRFSDEKSLNVKTVFSRVVIR